MLCSTLRHFYLACLSRRSHRSQYPVLKVRPRPVRPSRGTRRPQRRDEIYAPPGPPARGPGRLHGTHTTREGLGFRSGASRIRFAALFSLIAMRLRVVSHLIGMRLSNYLLSPPRSADREAGHRYIRCPASRKFFCHPTYYGSFTPYPTQAAQAPAPPQRLRERHDRLW